MLEAIRIVDPKIRFYQASSSETLGKAQAVPQDEETKLHKGGRAVPGFGLVESRGRLREAGHRITLRAGRTRRAASSTPIQEVRCARMWAEVRPASGSG